MRNRAKKIGESVVNPAPDKSDVEKTWSKIVLPVVFDPDSGSVICGMGVRLFSVLTPNGHPNNLIGPVVAAAINARGNR